MGDENTTLTEADARHLLRRAGFGWKQKDVDRLAGGSRGAAADDLLDFRPTRFRPRGDATYRIHDNWIKYMIRFRRPQQEKLVIFWHDHFATSDATVGDARLMSHQNRLLRREGKGNFKDLVKAIARDPAMMEFLNTARNSREVPNENFGRELLELFTLGVFDFAGNENYTQADIVQISRSLTGLRYADNQRLTVYLDEDLHDYEEDYPERLDKVIFKSTGGFGAGGRDFTVNGESTEDNPTAEIDTVIDILFEHTDSDGKNTVARHIARKLIAYYAYADPAAALVDEIIAASGFDVTWDIQALLRALFVHDEFYATATPPPFNGTTKKSVKWPIDFVVSTLRLLNMKLVGRYQYVNGGSYYDIHTQLTNMGQVLFEPPSVFGWDWETAWLSSSTLLARYAFARDVTSARANGRTGFRPHRRRFFDLSLTAPGDIADAATDVLGITDQFTTAERQALIDYLTDSGANPSLDLTDYDVRNIKLHGLFALLLQSPQYQVH